MDNHQDGRAVNAQPIQTGMAGISRGEGLISTKTAAKLLGVSQRRIRALCGQHRVPGALLIAGVWLVPDAPSIIPASRARPGKLKMEPK